MYFPKSQIKPNLYTNGEELVYKSNSQNYVGYYFQTSRGKFYTGANPSDSSQELIRPPIDDSSIVKLPFYEYDETPAYALVGDEVAEPINEKSYVIKGNLASPLNQTYLSLNSLPKDRLIPTPSITTPTEEEINKKEYVRYFAKSNLENLYIEIDKIQYDKFRSSDPVVAFNLYAVTYVPWSLANNAEQVNKNIVLLREKQLGWPMFHHYFSNNFGSTPLPQTENLYTKGGEFLLPNRTNYIGYYHIMPNGGFMTGKYHGDGAEIALISINPPTSDSSLSGGGSMSGGGGGGY